MVETIEIAGVKRPVSFSLRIAYIYEVKFGRQYLRDVMVLSRALQDVVSSDGEDQIFSLPIPLCADIFWAAFKNGARQTNVDFNFEPEDVVEWFLTDGNSLGTLMEMLMRSFPSENSGDVASIPSETAGEKNRRRRNGRK